MEKIILLGIALWFNFGLMDAFLPEKQVRKPYKPHVEFSDYRLPYDNQGNGTTDVNKQGPNKIRHIVKDMYPQ